MFSSVNSDSVKSVVSKIKFVTNSVDSISVVYKVISTVDSNSDVAKSVCSASLTVISSDVSRSEKNVEAFSFSIVVSSLISVLKILVDSDSDDDNSFVSESKVDVSSLVSNSNRVDLLNSSLVE